MSACFANRSPNLLCKQRKLELLLAQQVKATFFTGIRGSFGCDVYRREKGDCSEGERGGGLVGEERMEKKGMASGW